MPVGTGLTPIQAVNIYVGLSNAPEQNLCHMKAPQIIVPKKFQTGIVSQEVKMPGLTDFLYHGQDYAWTPGDEPARTNDWTYLSLVVGADYRRTHSIPVYTGKEAEGGQPYFKNYERKTQKLMNDARMACELHFLGQVHNTTKNNILTYGGTILENNDEFEFLATTRAGIREYIKECDALGLKKVMIVDSTSLRIMSSQKDCTGAGSPAAGIKSDYKGSMEEFKTWIADHLEIDEVWEYNSVYSNVIPQVSGYGETFNFSPRGISFHGIDKTQGPYNIDPKMTDNEVCSGTLAMCWSRYPEVAQWDDGPKYETGGCDVRYARRAINPLYDALKQDGSPLQKKLAITIPATAIYNPGPTFPT